MSSLLLRRLLAFSLLAVATFLLIQLVSGSRQAAEANGMAGADKRPAAPSSVIVVRLEEIARGLRQPLFVTHAGDRSGRLFIVEQTGAIRILQGGRLLAQPFLDLGREIDTAAGERGLLGLAFAPDYPASGRLYVSHTMKGRVRVARYRAAPDSDQADPGSRAIVLDMDDPAGNHNGGMLAFGPDGNLWVGTGDGGSGGDPWDNARNPRSLLGKMLRIDVRGDSYVVPRDNPFVGDSSAAPEVWALGLRNPWRYSFDRATGELWIGDVGQNAWEEIDVVQPAEGRRGARHFGWRTMEGSHCFDPGKGCSSAGLTPPVHDYGRDDGCSVTGGYVYRGRAIPALVGAYLFGDFCTGRIWTLRRDPSGPARVELLLDTRLAISSFGEDEAGELYVCDHAGGSVLRLDPAS